MSRSSLSLGLLLFSFFTLASGQTRPLLLEGADHLQVSRSAGEILLRGNVRFRHDDATFTTGQAQWNRALGMVRCAGGFRFSSPQGELVAQAGLYERFIERVTADGSAELRDSLNRTRLYGHRIVYDRQRDWAEASGNARLVVIEPDSSRPGKVVWDTLVMTAHRFEVDRGVQLAKALGRVTVRRGDLNVFCDTGLYRWEEGLLDLSGSPRATLGDVRVSGERMHVELEKNQRKLKKIRVEIAAKGAQDAPDRKTNEIQHSEVDGDTLEAWFDGKQILAFEARGSAVGRFYPESRRLMIDHAKGNHLRLDFLEGEPRVGRVEGEAKTVYYHFDQGLLEGRNEAIGDTILLGFEERQLNSVRLNGAGKGRPASGIYYGEPRKAESDHDSE